MLVETSKDIFWLVLAFCILWLTLFFSWLLYYFIKMFRQMSSITDKIEETVSLIHNMVKNVRDRSEQLAGYVAAVVKSSSELKKIFDRRSKRSKK